LYLAGLTALDVETAAAFAEYSGSVMFNDQTVERFIAAHPFGKDTALAHAIVRGGSLDSVTALDTDTATALVAFKGDTVGIGDRGLDLSGLQTASFGAVRVLRNRPNVYMPNHWYLLRYEIAALVGTVVFVVLAGIVVWYSRRHRDAALN
jgi:hypothetical protein